MQRFDCSYRLLFIIATINKCTWLYTACKLNWLCTGVETVCYSAVIEFKLLTWKIFNHAQCRMAQRQLK